MLDKPLAKYSAPLKASVIVLGSLALATTTGRTQAEKNLLTDSGFEEITNDSLVQWRTDTTSPFTSLKIVEGNPSLVRSGKYAVQVNQETLRANGDKNIGHLYTLNSVPIEANTSYDFSIWAKGKGTLSIVAYLYKMTGADEAFHSTTYLPLKSSVKADSASSNEWNQYVHRLDTSTLPPEVKSVRFVIAASGAWNIDDAAIAKTSGAAPANAAPVAAEAAEGSVRPNLITAGITAKAPQIDGRISDGEYTMVSTGLVESAGNTSYPLANKFGISYDTNNLYFGVSLRLPPGYQLNPDNKGRDDASLVADKNVFYFFLRPDSNAEAKGYEGLYLGVNPNGAIYDAWEKVSWTEGYVKRDTAFDAHLNLKSRVENGVWNIEFALPWKGSGLPKPGDATTLLSSFGFNLTDGRVSWQPHPVWFDHFQAFGEVRFSSQPLNVIMPSLGEISRGQLMPDFELGNRSGLQKPYDLTYMVSTPRMIAGQIGGYVFDVASMVKQEQFVRDQAIYYWQKSGNLAPGANHTETAQAPLKKPDFYVLEVEAKTDGKAVLYQKLPFHYSPPLVANLTPFPSANNIEMKLQMYGARADEKGQVEIAFKDAAGKTALTKTVRAAEDEVIVPVSMAALKPATYNVSLKLSGKDGKEVTTVQQPFTKQPTPDWLSDRKGIKALDADWVPAPWKPLTLKNDSVSLWGRTYNFKEGSLLQGVNSQGDPVVGGVSVHYQAGGKDYRVGISKPQFPLKKAGRVEVSQQGKTPHFSLQSRQKIEFDGMDRFDVELAPAGGSQKVDKVWIDIPFNQVKYWFSTSQEGLHGASWQAGLAPEGEVSKAASYNWIWMGNDKVGCTWYVENYKGWLINSQKPRIELKGTGTNRVLRLLVVNEPSEVSAPLKLTFGLFPTPVKPFYPGWRNARVQGLTVSEPPTSLTITSPDYWNSGYSKPSPRNWKALHDMVAFNRKRGQTTYPYLGLLYVSPYDYVKRDFGFMDFKGGPFPEGTVVKKRTETTRLEDYFYHKEDWHLVPSISNIPDWETREEIRVSPSGSWSDYFADGVDKLLEKSDVDGFFLDIDNPMLNLDPTKGLAYRTKDGIEEGTLELYALRDLYKRLYYIFDKRRGAGRKPYMLGHGFAAAAPYMSFWDMAVNGEEVKPAKNYDATKLFLQQRLKGDPIAVFGPGKTSYDGFAYRTIYGPQFGLPNMYLPQYGYVKELMVPENSREMLSLTFPHNSVIWAAEVLAQPIYDFWSKVEVPFGLGDSTFFPYWDNGVKTSVPNIKVSYWKKNGKNDYLVSLSNWADTASEVTVTLPAALTGFKTTIDMESGEKVAAGKTMTVKVPAHDLRAFRFTAGK